MADKKLKPGWKVWRFDQIATNVNARIDNPSESGMEHYVGLEHLDPDSLRIRRWGSPDDVEATKLVFKKGDIIFGRRRAYQRKLGVAEFDGICSAHAMVLRAKPEVVLPEFLPFFMQSDLFMNRAVEISVGSLSPTINWKTLAVQEFALPPLEEQQRLVDMLQAIEHAKEAHHNTRQAADQLVRSMLSELLNGDWPVVELGSVVQETQYGLSINAGSDGQYPMLRMMNIENGLCVENDIKYVNLTEKDFEAYRLVHGDVLFNRTNSYELVGRTGVYELEGEHVFASYLVRIKTNKEKLEPKFLTLYLNSDFGRRQVLAYATKAVSQANVNASNLLRVRLPLPPLEMQQKVLDDIARAKSAEDAVVARYSVLDGMKKRFLTGNAEGTGGI
ncbi:restriction endonuclease subunit S [Pseudomonas aeruginosa]|uniref:restriction endonuclease subunit S n=1 Tax=Pseudomonas aeruginosa TaxID=287 RepID=UPI00097E6330|nr:restriction endonuclease subunit S [Pseudomonas aeruginosa]EKV8012084.1 restriction endonuclease subunit S [Pseudomonas aeruginosa]MBG5796962.1 restriction endonuclease subunit S [Pseudomonas aeruginosa]MBP8316209.1 restriction endonuclease subunit S [Pseudomonas aeruginosa]MBP8346531.1 restriction endonuclease subunit S [Pseudomonas aeruginosa]ONM81688.1 restriction endonuclease subunit S [Pseudomonas aeruginosa]